MRCALFDNGQVRSGGGGDSSVAQRAVTATVCEPFVPPTEFITLMSHLTPDVYCVCSVQVWRTSDGDSSVSLFAHGGNRTTAYDYRSTATTGPRVHDCTGPPTLTFGPTMEHNYCYRRIELLANACHH